MRCSVYSCTNDTKKITKSQGITFHIFPKEPLLRTAWIEALGISDWQPKERSTICSEHFHSCDLYDTKGGLRKIKKGALPVKPKAGIERVQEYRSRKTGTTRKSRKRSLASDVENGESAASFVSCILEDEHHLSTPIKKRNPNKISRSLNSSVSDSAQNNIGETSVIGFSNNVAIEANVKTSKRKIISSIEGIHVNNVPKVEILPNNEVQYQNFILPDNVIPNFKIINNVTVENNLHEDSPVKSGDTEAPCIPLNEEDEKPKNSSRRDKIKHTKKEFSCNICQRKFAAKGRLKRHLLKHTGEKPYKCDYCDFKCSQKSNLQIHMQYKHTKEKNYSCHLCQYKCVEKGALNRHLLKHTGEKPYVCELCDFKCTQKFKLKIHIQYRHTKEKNFSCHICSYECVEKADLYRHFRKHDRENSYVCDFRLSHKSNSKRRLQYRRKEKNFSCHICQYKCYEKGTLNRHLLKHTGDPQIIVPDLPHTETNANRVQKQRARTKAADNKAKRTAIISTKRVHKGTENELQESPKNGNNFLKKPQNYDGSEEEFVQNAVKEEHDIHIEEKEDSGIQILIKPEVLEIENVIQIKIEKEDIEVANDIPLRHKKDDSKMENDIQIKKEREDSEVNNDIPIKKEREDVEVDNHIQIKIERDDEEQNEIQIKEEKEYSEEEID